MWKAFRVKQSLENGMSEEKNKNGFSIRKLIMERGSDELKKRLEEKYA